MSDESKAKAEALARRLAEKGYKLWQEGPCHDPQCGCVTEHEVREFAPVLEKLYEALDSANKFGFGGCHPRDSLCRKMRAALALFEQPDSTEVKP